MTTALRRSQRSFRIVQTVAVVLCVASAALLVLGGVSAWKTYAFFASAERADGVVIDLERHVSEHRSGGNGKSRKRTIVTFRPVVTFEVDGQEYTFTNPSGTNPPSHEIGDDAVVRYAPGDPTDARLDGAGAYMSTVIAGGVGVILGVIGGLILRATIRSSKRP